LAIDMDIGEAISAAAAAIHSLVDVNDDRYANAIPLPWKRATEERTLSCSTQHEVQPPPRSFLSSYAYLFYCSASRNCRRVIWLEKLSHVSICHM